MKRKYFPGVNPARYIFTAAACAISLFLSLLHLIHTGNRPWSEERLAINGPSYLRGMVSILEKNNFLDLEDLRHAPGYQIYLSFLYKTFPLEKQYFILVKTASWGFFLLTLLLVFRIGEKHFGRYTGIFGVLIMAYSHKAFVYISLLQYEIPALFLTTLLLYMLLEWSPGCRYSVLYLICCGLLAGLAALLHIRFVLLFAAGIIFLFLRMPKESFSARLKYTAVFIFPFLFLFGSWILYQSFRLGEFFSGTTDIRWLFSLRNNLNAQGYNFPYPVLSEPSGFAFILGQPLVFFKLLCLRILYLWDLKRDIWYLGHPISSLFFPSKGFPAEFIFNLTGMLLFICGMFLKLIRDIKEGWFRKRMPLYLFFAALPVASLLISSGSRLLIPVLSLVALFQGYALKEIITVLKH